MKTLIALLLTGLSLAAADVTNCVITVQTENAAGKQASVQYTLSDRELRAWDWKSENYNAGSTVSTNEVVEGGVTNIVVSTNYLPQTYRRYMLDQLEQRIANQVRWSREERLAAIARRASALTNDTDLVTIENQLPK